MNNQKLPQNKFCANTFFWRHSLAKSKSPRPSISFQRANAIQATLKACHSDPEFVEGEEPPHLHLLLLLHLPLQVPAVILTLSEVEWGRIPKETTRPNPSDLSTHTFQPLPLSFRIQPQAVSLPATTLDTPATIKSGRNPSPAQAGLSTLAP
jgi:hypothetical protein